jgi:hypothetical protein
VVGSDLSLRSGREDGALLVFQEWRARHYSSQLAREGDGVVAWIMRHAKIGAKEGGHEFCDLS